MMTKAQKSEYNRQWYLANRSYKKTYQRLHSRANNAEGLGFFFGSDFDMATDILIEDRQRQIASGRWIDERTQLPYTGIVSPKTYM